MAEPTPAAREAFLWMQGRMIELILRHDTARFRDLFEERQRPPETLSERERLLQRSRDLAVLFHLQTELFDSILPLIKRRLSFAAPRTMRREPVPPRGRIDWPRTTAATWRDRPGQAPLEVITRQRRRHFATPENLLTVVTLVEYQTIVQEILDTEVVPAEDQALRDRLYEIIDTCRRELAFPQFAGLISTAQAITDGYTAQSPAELEYAVESNLLPGRNSAYDELLIWRRKLRQLRLLDPGFAPPQLTLGANPERDNYLYQLWLFYELGDLLAQRKCLQQWNHERMVITFTWGDDSVAYRLQHDQAIRAIPRYWANAPGVRPDFYIERQDRQTIQHKGQVTWHEPGYVLDAKYYKPEDSERAPSSPIKRMIADLQLTGERSGALLFAFHGSAADTIIDSAAVQPRPAAAFMIPADFRIHLLRVAPAVAASSGVQKALAQVLDLVHATLRTPVPVRCQGVFLDPLSRTAHGALSDVETLHARQSTSADEDTAESDLLLCPKPHISPHHTEVVSLTHDCLLSARCHVRGQALIRPAQLTFFKDVVEALRPPPRPDDQPATRATERARGQAYQQATERATRQVRMITERYANLLQYDLTKYQARVRALLDVLDDEEATAAMNAVCNTTLLLDSAQWNTLALACFLEEQLNHIDADNYSGATLLFTAALESAISASIYHVMPVLTSDKGEPLMPTLGTVALCKGRPPGEHRPGFSDKNWAVLEAAIVGGGHWRGQPTAHPYTFSHWIDDLQKLVNPRNDAAHRAFNPPKAFRKVKATLFGSHTTPGVLNGLLLSWVPDGSTTVAITDSNTRGVGN